jgi:hypothetical protein
MIILDTNVVSELMKPQPEAKVIDWLMPFDQGVLATTAITVAEIEFGLQRLPLATRKTQLYAHFETYLSALKILALDDIAARLAGRFWAMRHAEGFSAQSPDMMIAGIAAANNATLATRNVRDFAHLPLKVIDPWG